MQRNPVDAAYRSKTNCVDYQTATTSLKDLAEGLATFPLIVQPGRPGTIGRHRPAGPPGRGHHRPALPDQFMEKVLEPLGMVDTAFDVPADKPDRFAANYQACPAGSSN